MILRRKTSQPDHLLAGEWVEGQAVRFLKGKGFKILGRWVWLGSREELDLVVHSRGRLIFIEVKTRRSESFGRPATAINAAKRKILRRAARHYLARLQTKPSYYRFDVIEVIGFPHAKEPPVVRHIENAFPIEGDQPGHPTRAFRV